MSGFKGRESEIASSWWADNIGQGQKNVSQRQSESALQKHVTQSSRVTEQERCIFKKALKGIIERELRVNGMLSLSVDYVPDENLSEAARISGAKITSFPLNTIMIIDSGDIYVSSGGSPFAVVEEKQEVKQMI